MTSAVARLRSVGLERSSVRGPWRSSSLWPLRRPTRVRISKAARRAGVIWSRPLRLEGGAGAGGAGAGEFLGDAATGGDDAGGGLRGPVGRGKFGWPLELFAGCSGFMRQSFLRSELDSRGGTRRRACGFAFDLDLFQGSGGRLSAAACEEACVVDAELCSGGGVAGPAARGQRVDDELLAAQGGEGAGPGLEAAPAVVDLVGGAGEVDAAVFAGEDGREGGRRVVLRWV